MRRAYVLIMFFCLSAAARTIAQDASPVTLSLDDALKRGMENNLDLQKSQIDLAMAEYSAKRLWSQVFPTISGSLGVSYGTELFSGDGFQLNADGAGANAGTGINLTLNAGIPYAMKNIRLAHQRQILSYEDARNLLEIEITKNFYSLIAGRDNIASLEDVFRLAQLQYERNQVAFRNGLAGEMTLMQSRLSMENARYSLGTARSAYANRMGEFLAQLEMTQDTDVTLEGTIVIVKIEIDTERVERLILENLPRRPDIVSHRQEIERLQNEEKKLAYSSRAPSLRLGVDWAVREFDPLTDSLSASASLSIPVNPWIPGTTQSQSIREAKLAIDKARLDLKSTEDTAKTKIRSLAANLRDSWDDTEIARLSLTIAERSYELTEQGFRNGTVESLNLEDARNNLLSARRRLLQSELAYLNMILDISAALNINWKDLM